MHLIIHACVFIVYALFKIRNSMKIMKIDGNTVEFWWILCKNIILTFVSFIT